MRSASVGCGYNAPLRIVPQRGQVPENVSDEPVSKEPWDVLQERVVGSYFAKDSRRIGPEIAFVGGTFALAGDGVGLAREARSNDIHQPTPRFALESADIVPYREHIKQTVPLASEQHFASVRGFFHGTDTSPSEQSGAEEPATSAGK
jgi:hypothetical protein